MNEEMLDKIHTMLYSGDEELTELARRLFWTGNPTFDDYLNIMQRRHKNFTGDITNFEKSLSHYVKVYTEGG